MCVSRRYVGRAVGVDAFEVSCLRPSEPALHTVVIHSSAPPRRATRRAPQAAPRRDAASHRQPVGAPRRRSTRPRRSLTSSSRTRPPSSRESSRSRPRALASPSSDEREVPESRIYERVAENLAELAHALALGRANIGQDTEGCTVHLVPASARAERHRRGDGAHAPLPAAGVAGGRRRARRVARAAGAVRLPRSGRAVERRDVAEHPRGVGDGPPPLPRGACAAARDRAHRGDARAAARVGARRRAAAARRTRRANAVQGYHTRRLRELAAAYPTVEDESVDPPAANLAEATGAAAALRAASERVVSHAADAAFAAKLAKWSARRRRGAARRRRHDALRAAPLPPPRLRRRRRRR